MTDTPTTGTQPTAGTAADPEHPHRYTAALANAIETRWQGHWAEHETFATRNPGDAGFDSERPKLYVLDMFPYPSGIGLHVGHPLGYIATDIYTRFQRMRGFNVLHPMGFDAFGLPAEQFAVEHGVHPRITTQSNIDNMSRQLKALGLGYDWKREVATTDPDYYRWTQWIFLQLYGSWFDPQAHKARPIADLVERLNAGSLVVDDEGRAVAPDSANGPTRPFSALSDAERDDLIAAHRLAYLAEVPVNWCPALGTVLANEEVTNDGRSDRGNYPVFKRPLKQWMLRITAYAERLGDDLQHVDWPEPIKLMQRNWLGRSEGALIDFPIAGGDGVIRVFTTRPDTVFGATYMVLAPEHPLVETLTSSEERGAVERYRAEAAARTDVDRMAEAKTKTGVPTGGFAVNPATGERIPVWIADYVLMGYGTGAIMAVPAHDLRDAAFALQFGLPLRCVVEPPAGYEPTPEEKTLVYDGSRCVFVGEGTGVDSANDGVSLNGLPSAEAKKRITDWLESEGLGRFEVQYKLRDWLFSRQRYWGEPFPILHGPDGRIEPVDESELPVALPEMKEFTPEASDPDDAEALPRPPLARAPESWRVVERDGVCYQRELNTMPQWAGSCWYYLRFIDPRNGARFAAAEAERYWMGGKGVDLYVGGAEHAVLHLLYARFWHKVLHDLGHVSTPEPFGRLFNQGYIQAYCYRDERGVAVPAEEVTDEQGHPAGDVQDRDAKFTWKGQPVVREYGKMGKSLKNAVGPDEVCREYGCDTLRLYEMYLGPLEASKSWNPRDIIGPFRFIQRLWRLVIDEQTGETVLAQSADGEVERRLHATVARVTQDVERLAFNTAIAAMIEFVNAATNSAARLSRDQAERFVLVLAPFAPHVAEEIWARLGHAKSLADEPWPAWDESALEEDTVELPVQVGGKVRARITVPAAAESAEIEQAALADERVKAALGGKSPRKVIVVPGKIVNVVA
jgi:leucyl-tRNA synthetase